MQINEVLFKINNLLVKNVIFVRRKLIMSRVYYLFYFAINRIRFVISSGY